MTTLRLYASSFFNNTDTHHPADLMASYATNPFAYGEEDTSSYDGKLLPQHTQERMRLNFSE